MSTKHQPTKTKTYGKHLVVVIMINGSYDISYACAEKQQKQSLEVFYKKGVLKSFVIFTGKQMCWSLFFDKVTDLQAGSCLQDCSFIKKRFQHKCFSVNVAKCLRTPILKNICEQLPLKQLFSKRLMSNYFCLLNFYQNEKYCFYIECTA